ncbi:U3 snoRNP protein [Chytriomyces hyalinus]|nr:U3 snoRNP protein [Chytriomyces hyalinus]
MSRELNKTGGANRYRYQSFTERIKTIKIDSVHKVVKNNVGINATNSQDVECFFVDGLAHWQDLNCTNEFTSFRREVTKYAQSLQQILYHQTEIVDLIVKYLENPNCLAAEPLMSLSTLLARDLQEEFFPHFPRVLTSILSLIHKTDAKLLEAIFNSVAYLFKYLAQEVSDDVLPTFKIFQRVLQDHRPYIRLFGAEAFGFIVRKVSGDNLTAFLKYTIKSLQKEMSEAYSEGVALLMFETLKQVRNTLHSRAIAILRLNLNLVLSMCPDSEDIAFLTLNKTIICLGHHITPETSEDLWEFLTETLTLSLEKFQQDSSLEERFRKISELFASLTLLRRGSKMANRKTIFGIVDTALTALAAKDSRLSTPFVRCLASLVAFSPLEDILVAGKGPLQTLFGSKDSVNIFMFCELLQRLKSDHLAKIVMPHLISFLAETWETDPAAPMLYISSLIDTNFESQIQYISHEFKTPDGCIKLPASIVKAFKATVTSALNVSNVKWDTEIEALVHGDMTTKSRLAETGIAIACTQIVSMPVNEVFAALEQFLLRVLDDVEGKVSPGMFEGEFGTVSRRACVAVLVGKALNALVTKCVATREVARLAPLFRAIVVRILTVFEGDVRAIEAVAGFVEITSSLSSSISLTTDDYEKILQILSPNVGSVDPAVRLHSLRIIIALSGYVANQDVQVFQIALDIERVEDSLATFREKSMLIKRIDNLLLAKMVSKANEEAAVRYCLALLSSKFSMIHAEVSTVLVNFAKRNYDLFWKHYLPVLLTTKKQGHKPIDFDLNFAEVTSTINLDKRATTLCTYVNKVMDISQKTAARFQNLDEFGRRAFFETSTAAVNRLDDKQYYLLLLKVLRSLPNLVEQKSSQLFPLYFELLHSDIEDTEEEKDEEDEVDINEQVESSSIRGIVVEFLHVFENLKNPASTTDASKLYASFLDLLSNGDAKIQQLALNCVLTWKQPGIVAYAEHLRGLTEDAKFRDFLSTLDIDALRTGVKMENQPALLQALVRILYGKLISRRGRGSSKVGLKARRNAIFAFMVSLDDGDREFLIDLMVAPFKSILKQESVNMDGEFAFADSIVASGSSWPIKFQLGFMNIIEDSIKQLKNHIAPVLPRVLSVIMYLMNAAEREVIDESIEVVDVQIMRVKQLKDVRQLCIHRLAQLFNSIDGFDFAPYVPAIYESIIDRRIPKFDTENTQASSALMDVLVAWSKRKEYVMFLNHRAELLPKLLAVLAAKNVQESVTSIVVGVFESILVIDKENPDMNLAEHLIKPNMSHMLKNFEVLLSKLLLLSTARYSSISLTSRVISVLAQTSKFVSSPVEAESLMVILMPCLRKRTQTVSEQLKVDILEILANCIPILPSLQDPATRMEAPYFVLICQMLSTLTERVSRSKAVNAFRVFAALETKLQPIVALVEKFNAYLPRRIEEPDFNLRFDAFTEVGQDLYKTLDSDQWLPVLHSLVHSLQDVTEFSIRTSAAFCLSKFIEVASGQAEDVSSSDPAQVEKLRAQVIHVLLPAVKKAVKSNVELVRSEFMTLLGIMVKNFPEMDEFKDLVVLLADADDEASFFSNVYHMQMHRRIRSLKRLSEICSTGSISQSNVANIFLPLVTHVIFEANRQVDNNIMNEAITTIAACATCLSWGKYHDLIKRFLKAIARRPLLEKELIRVVVAVLENFKFQMVPTAAAETIAADTAEVAAIMDVDSDGEDDEMDVDAKPQEKLENIEQMQRIHTTVVKKLIPDLFGHLTKNDDENVNLRVPVAVAITKLLLKLPEESMNVELPRLLTTVCQFLKNRLQDVRDGCRDALLKIARELGPAYFPFIIKELQGALLRGYQLHVLGFTVHHLLVGVTDTFGESGFDTSIDMLVRIFVKDIFGEISDEREVEEMNGKLKEQKRTKSFDSFELVSRVMKLDKVTTLLLPLKELMLESNSSKTSNKIQDILRKVVTGLNANTKLDETELLVFVHGLITENLPLSKVAAYKKDRKTEAEKRITVQMRRNEPLEDMLTYFKANAYMFIDFGMSLLLVTIKKDMVRQNNPEHLKMMDPLVEILSKSLYSQHSTVVVNALRIFSLLVKWPLPSLEVSIPVIVKRLFDLFLKKGDGSAEKSDAALKLLGVIIKECPYANINQKQIMTLITVLTPELEEPDRQSAAFALIRSILNRKYIFAEMYDLMAVVSKIMITSQSTHVRDMCRQCHSQFLLEYPHGPMRLKKEFNYLMQNLNYEFESGRESVLLFFSTCIPKLSDVILAEFSEMLLLSFVMVLVNDESPKCREKGSDLIKLLIRHSSPAKRETFLKLAEKWFDQSEQPQLLRTAAQLLGLFVDSVSERDMKPALDQMVPKLISILALVRDEAEKASYVDEDSMQQDSADGKLEFWQAGYYTLNTFNKMFSKSPSLIQSALCADIWEYLKHFLLYPHTWMRSISCKLFGVLFASVDLDAPVVDPSNAALQATILDARSITFISMQFTKQLESTQLAEDLAKQIVKNLLFIGKCIMRLHDSEEVQEEAEMEELDDEEAAANELMEVGDGEDDQDKPAGNPLLVKIFKRLAYIGRADQGKSKTLLRKSVFQWYGAMMLSLKCDDYRPYLVPAMSILYRTINSFGQDPEEIKTLAKEISEHLQNHVGITVYLEVYNSVHTRVQEVRQGRKTQRKVQAIVDPVSSAKRREQKNQTKKAGKKRRAEEFSKSRIRTGNTKRARNM